MHFVWADSNYESVFIVQAHHFEYEFSIIDDIVVVFIPPCCGCEFGAGDLGDWGEVEVGDGGGYEVEDDGCSGSQYNI